MTQVHNYDPANGAYIGSNEAALDPFEGKPVVPAHSTFVPPPSFGTNEVPVWDDDKWELKPDHRGEEYWLADGSQHVITELGVAPPVEALDAAPNLPTHPTSEVALRAAYDWIEQLVHNEIDNGKPVSEVMTYPMRAAAARAVVAGTASDVEKGVLITLLVAEGHDEAAAIAAVPNLAATIKAKADRRDIALAFTTAMRRDVESKIASANVESDPFAFDKILRQAAIDATAKWAELSA